MSKATFYEHFANKEECILGLMTRRRARSTTMAAASVSVRGNYQQHVRDQLGAFLSTLTEYPTTAQTVLVEAVALGPQASERATRCLPRSPSRAARQRARRSVRRAAFAARRRVRGRRRNRRAVSRHLRTGVPRMRASSSR
jgi:AcrR family transcriptional regulator